MERMQLPMPMEPNGDRVPAAAALAEPLVAFTLFSRLVIAMLSSRAETIGVAHVSAQQARASARNREPSMVTRLIALSRFAW
jgi:hypothetical protein